ncbi:NAD-dependent epimerase/dehydratase [Anaeromyxobacter sp. K]|uniref:NAD-dependent epimerase/dehydratase family protein n=1 Tax=Anaeromyxobacter sp. (strain K) TaxID=447217 RepID=UPI00015F9FC3|nr:NAD-dependent epimerase/dehydratase family protein [Anaeromyxobacter sp. K]ACG73367.1 NAD-dependent epimerase/dehydratase [Anaeromyxobacter sp. K]
MAGVALITGSGGAVADAVAAELARAGWTPRPVALSAEGFRGAGETSAGAVVHLGVRTPRDLPEPARIAVEAGAARAAAELARRAGALRLVHVSTAGVYGRPRNLPCREGELKAPRTAHERVRWAAEQASWAAFRKGAPLTVLRPTVLYGPSLRGGPLRVLALVALFNQRRRRVPIIRRGPVAHLLHLDDLARAVVHVLDHPDAEAVRGRAFNVADEAPLPLAEHLAAALTALGYEPGRILPTAPRLTSALLWLVRHVPDRALLARINGRLARGWGRLSSRTGVAPALVPRIEREALHWMSADHYYDTSRLEALGWRPRHPISTAAMPETVRALVSDHLLPGSGAGALPAW